jgi:hypothetical protein
MLSRAETENLEQLPLKRSCRANDGWDGGLVILIGKRSAHE